MFWPDGKPTWALVGGDAANITAAASASVQQAVSIGREQGTLMLLVTIFEPPRFGRLWLLASGYRIRQFAVAAQRTAQHRLPFLEVQFLPALCHLLLELFVAQHDPLSDVDHHVVDRTVAQSRPVPRIGDVLVRRRIVEISSDPQNRALRQERRRVVGVAVDP